MIDSNAESVANDLLVINSRDRKQNLNRRPPHYGSISRASLDAPLFFNQGLLSISYRQIDPSCHAPIPRHDISQIRLRNADRGGFGGPHTFSVRAFAKLPDR